MWSFIYFLFAMLSLFMMLWILDGETDSTFLGSEGPRTIITTAFGLLTMVFLYVSSQFAWDYRKRRRFERQNQVFADPANDSYREGLRERMGRHNRGGQVQRREKLNK